jgi:ClpX C4-type zinc finger
MFKRRLACSFCGRKAADVGKLVAGPHAYICDRCAAEAVRIMNESSGEAPSGARHIGWFARVQRAVRTVARRCWPPVMRHRLRRAAAVRQ